MLRWADSFEHYGTGATGRANMLRGAWASIHSANNAALPVIVDEQHRTGGHGLKFYDQADASNQLNGRSTARRVLGTISPIIGIGVGYYLPSLPTVSNRVGFCFENNVGNVLLTFHIGVDGSLIGRIGGLNSEPFEVTDPVLTAGGWHHIEVKAGFDETAGFVELRVNGITMMLVSGLELIGEPVSVRFGFVHEIAGGATETSHYIDDVFCWDDHGSTANNFLGVQRAYTVYAVADGAITDWVPTGETTLFECIDDEVPDDDDTYISSADSGDVCEFGIGALPPEVDAIAAVYIPTLAKLKEAGTGDITVSMVSNEVVSEGDAKVLTPSYLYHGTAHTVDPNTGAAWSRTALGAASVRIEKVT